MYFGIIVSLSFSSTFSVILVETVAMMKARGIEFLTIPDTYYETVLDRVGEIELILGNVQEPPKYAMLTPVTILEPIGEEA